MQTQGLDYKVSQKTFVLTFEVVLDRIRRRIQSVTIASPLVAHSSLLATYVYCVAGQRGSKLIFLSQCNLGYKVTRENSCFCRSFRLASRPNKVKGCLSGVPRAYLI